MPSQPAQRLRIALVQALRNAGQYTVELYRPDGSRRVTVDHFTAYHVADTEALTREALAIPLILTSLFSQNLPQVAPLVAQIITARCAAGIDRPLNVICCENMQDSSTTFRAMVEPLLTEHESEYAACLVGFPNCMISRVVPADTDTPLTMVAEDYNEWTVDAGAFVGPPLDLPALELVTNQTARLARKFFLHNGAHAVCGYWGFHRGHTYVHEAVADPFVLGHVGAAIEELAQIVSRHYELDLDSVRAYGLELGSRGAVAQLHDPILRVVRDPLRKLSRAERFVAPAELALTHGLPCAEIVRSVAAVLHYYHPDDPHAVQMRRQLQSQGPQAAIPELLGLPPDHQLIAPIVAEYEAWTPPAESS